MGRQRYVNVQVMTLLVRIPGPEYNESLIASEKD